MEMMDAHSSFNVEDRRGPDLTSFSLEALPNSVVALPLGFLRGPDQSGDYN